MQNKTIAIIVLAVAAVAYSVGRYAQPAKVQIKTEQVVKEVEVVKKDVVIVEKEIKRPDGTIEKERKIVDKSSETTKKDSESKSDTKISRPDWKVQATAGMAAFRGEMIYGIGIERRILGPIAVGAFGQTNGVVGLSVSLEF